MNAAARGFLVGVAILYATFAVLSIRDCQARGDTPPAEDRYPATMCWCDRVPRPNHCWCRMSDDGGWNDEPGAVEEMRAMHP